MNEIKMLLDYLIVPLFLYLFYQDRKITELKVQIRDIEPMKRVLSQLAKDVHTLVTLSKIHYKQEEEK